MCPWATVGGGGVTPDVSRRHTESRSVRNRDVNEKKKEEKDRTERRKCVSLCI